MIIIPAIDLIDGKCVRLSKGDFATKKVYNENPLEVAKIFENIGITRLHVVDLDGAKAGQLKQLKSLENLATNTKLEIDFGGGIKNSSDVTSVFNAGAAFATIGSLAVNNPATLHQFIKQFGKQRFLIGVDVLNNEVKTNGWATNSGINIFDFIKTLNDIGIQQIFCTDIEKDGMQNGPSLKLYEQILSKHYNIPLIASGGVTTISDIELLKNIGCYGAIIGKALYEGTILLTDLKKFA